MGKNESKLKELNDACPEIDLTDLIMNDLIKKEALIDYEKTDQKMKEAKNWYSYSLKRDNVYQKILSHVVNHHKHKLSILQYSSKYNIKGVYKT